MFEESKHFMSKNSFTKDLSLNNIILFPECSSCPVNYGKSVLNVCSIGQLMRVYEEYDSLNGKRHEKIVLFPTLREVLTTSTDLLGVILGRWRKSSLCLPVNCHPGKGFEL